jgi:chromosome segregation ATPase
VHLSTELLSRPLSSKRLDLKRRAVERITQEKERWETLVRQCLGVADVCVARGQPQFMGKDDLATVSKLLANAQTRLLGGVQFPNRKDAEEFRGKVWEVFTDLNHGVWKSCFNGKQTDEASLLRRQLEETQGKVDELARDLKLAAAKPAERPGKALSDTNRLRAELVFLTKANRTLQADLDCANSRAEALELKLRRPHSPVTPNKPSVLAHIESKSQEQSRWLGGESKQISLDKRPNLRQVSVLPSSHRSMESSSILFPQKSSEEEEVSRLRDKLQKEKERSLNFYRALKRKEKECQDNHASHPSIPSDGNSSKHRLEEENAKLQQQLRGSGKDAVKLADELEALLTSYSSLQRDFERQASHLSKLEKLLPKQPTDLNDSFTQTSRLNRTEIIAVRSPGRLRKSKRQAKDNSVEIQMESHEDISEVTAKDEDTDQVRSGRGVSREQRGELDELRKANSQLRANQSAIAISQGQLTQDLTDLQTYLKGKLDTAYSTIKLLESEKQELTQQVSRLVRQLEVLQDEKTQRETELKILNAEKSFDRMEIEGLRNQLSPRGETSLKVSHLENKLEQVVQSLAARDDSLSSLASDNRLLREANDQLELQVRHFEKGLEGSHEDCKLKLSSKEQEVRSLQGHTADLLRKINSLHEELGMLRSANSALETSITDLGKKSYEDLTRQVGELKQKVEILTSKSGVLETQSNKWKGEALRLEGELTTAGLGASNRQRADAEAHKQLKAKQERIFTLVSENEILRSEAEHFKERAREAKAAESKAISEAERMNKVVADTTENLRKLEGDISCIDTQYRGLSEENKTLYSQKTTLEAAVKEVWTKMKSCEAKVADFDKERQAHKDQLGSLNLQLHSQLSLIEGLEETRSDFELRIRQMEEAEARQRDEMEQYVEELGLMKSQEEQLKGHCKALDAKLTMAADDKQRLELALSEGTRAVLDKAAEISQLTTHIAQLETSLAAALGKRREVEEALTMARQELKQSEQRAQDSDKRLVNSQSTVSMQETQIKELQLLKTGLEGANYDLEEKLRSLTEEGTTQTKAMLAEAAALRQDVSRKETQIKELQLLKAGLEGANYDLEEKLRRSTEEDTTQTKALLDEATALRQANSLLTQAKTACESEVQLLSQSEGSLKAQLARATEAQAEASRLLREAESRLETLEKGQSLALSQVADLTESSARYLARIKTLEEDVKVCEEAKAAGLQRESDMEHKLSALSETEATLGSNLTKQREISAKLSSENEQLRSNLSRAERKTEDIVKKAAVDREQLAQEAKVYSALVTEVSQLIGIKPPTADPQTHRGLVDDIGAFLKQEAILDRLVAALKVTRIEEVEEAVRLSLGAAAKVEAAEAESKALSRVERELSKQIEGLTKAKADASQAYESQIAALELQLQEREADLQDQVDRLVKSFEEAVERHQALTKQLVEAQSNLEESAKELSTLKQQHAVCSLTEAELQREIEVLARAQRTSFSSATTEPNSPREGTEMQRQLVMTVASLRRAEGRCKELERQNEEFRELMTAPQRDDLDDDRGEKQLAAFKREAADTEKWLVFEIQQLKESLADFNAEIQGLNEENERLVLQLAQSNPDETSSLVQAKAAITTLKTLLNEARGQPEGEVEVCRRIGYNGTDWLLLRSEEDMYYWMRLEEAGRYVQDLGEADNMPEE